MTIATDRVNSGHIQTRGKQATSDEPKHPHRHRSVGLVGRRSGALVKAGTATNAVARSTRSRLFTFLQQADIGHALALLAFVARSKRPEVAEVLDAMRFEGWEELLVPAARRVRNQPRASADLARRVVECLPVMNGLAGEVEAIAFDSAERELPEHVEANMGSVRHLAAEKGRSIVHALNMARLPLNYSRAGVFVERYVARALDADGRIDPDRVAEDALVTLGGFTKKAANNAINNARFEKRR
jgi:hypothetical protein